MAAARPEAVIDLDRDELVLPDEEAPLAAPPVDPDPDVRPRSKVLRARVLLPAAVLLGVLAVAIGVTRARSESPPPAHGRVGVGTPLDVTRGRGATVVVGDGLTRRQVPAGGVGLVPAQVATVGPDGRAIQSARTDSAASTTTTTP